MVELTALWLPIVLSAVIVFIASSIIHMALPYHKSDYKKMPGEEAVLGGLREAKVPPGTYVFPCPDDRKHMRSPEMIEKYTQGPVGFFTVIPSGPPSMAKPLVNWFIFCLVMSVFVAYLAGRTLAPGIEYLTVFRVTGTAAFLGYSMAHAIQSIWMGRAWSSTFKHVFDGLIYSLLTAGVFGWLWP